MKSNVSEYQFLEGEDIVVVQSNTANDPIKADVKHVKVKSLREDVRNYVEQTTTKELKVFRSTTSTAGGRIDVLDNETLYYYPATPTSSLQDEDIELTSTGDYFTGIDNQKEFNEKASDQIVDIELTLEDTNKYLEALKASTTFLPDNVDPTEVDFFITTNKYPNTPANPPKGAVVNINDLMQVNSELQDTDINLQGQIDLAELRIGALFNVKVDSGYFVHQSADPENDLPGIGQIKTDLTNTTDDIVAVVHAVSYDAVYVDPEDPDNTTMINNYLVANVGDTIVTGFNRFKLTSVEAVDPSAALAERIYILKGTSVQTIIDQVGDTEFNTLRIVGDGEFDPATLVGEYVRTAGDNMSGTLSVGTDDTHAITVGDLSGNVNLQIEPSGAAITTRGVNEFTATELVTKQYVDTTLSNADLDAYVKKSGDKMTGDLEIRTPSGSSNTVRLKCNVIDSGQDSNLQIKRNNVAGISINKGTNTLHQKTSLSVEGDQDGHLVTKKYVDNKFGSISVPDAPDLKGYVKSKDNQYTISRDSNGQYYIEQ